ncbi:MAG TPA: ATP-binding protein [Acidobacteriota bacterium]|nr:ATP-binding protein [Acidobacteriota bacterium]
MLGRRSRARAHKPELNEILSNSLRHAFPMDRNGTIYIHFLRRDDDYLLQIGDDGIGLPQEIDFDSQITLGLRLVLTLVSQLNGTVRIDRSQGTVFQIEFP